MWLVDPEPQTLEVYRLDGETYRLLATYAGDAQVRAEPFDGLCCSVQREPCLRGDQVRGYSTSQLNLAWSHAYSTSDLTSSSLSSMRKKFSLIRRWAWPQKIRTWAWCR